MEIRDVIFRIEQERKEQNAIYHAAAAKFGLTDSALWAFYCISKSDEDQTQQDLCRPLKAAEEQAYGRLSEAELSAYLQTLGKLNEYLREETEKL